MIGIGCPGTPAPADRAGLRLAATGHALALLCAIAVCAAGCGTAHERKPAESTSAAARAGAAEPVEEMKAHADRESIYDLDLALTDQNGAARHLADLKGRPMLAAMMYTHCKSVCPRVTADLREIEKRLGPVAGSRVRFVLFSLDPERDSPAAMREYARENGLDLKRWTLFSPAGDGTRDLAAVLGVKYRADESGEISHSAMIFLIDRDGVVRHRQVGINQDPQELIAAVEQVK